jgi:hypothetical protein
MQQVWQQQPQLEPRLVVEHLVEAEPLLNLKQQEEGSHENTKRYG